jgi:hypothetical protein
VASLDERFRVQRRLLLQPAIALVMSQSGRPCNLLHQPVDSIKTQNSAAVGPRVFRFHRLSLQTIFGEAADTEAATANAANNGSHLVQLHLSTPWSLVQSQATW